MNYHETILSLFNLLAQANLADTDQAAEWQHAKDSRQKEYYGFLVDAVVNIAGPDIHKHWCETGEVNLNLANRA